MDNERTPRQRRDRSRGKEGRRGRRRGDDHLRDLFDLEGVLDRAERTPTLEVLGLPEKMTNAELNVAP
jgi:hypothetical protein